MLTKRLEQGQFAWPSATSSGRMRCRRHSWRPCSTAASGVRRCRCGGGAGSAQHCHLPGPGRGHGGLRNLPALGAAFRSLFGMMPGQARLSSKGRQSSVTACATTGSCSALQNVTSDPCRAFEPRCGDGLCAGLSPERSAPDASISGSLPHPPPEPQVPRQVHHPNQMAQFSSGGDTLVALAQTWAQPSNTLQSAQGLSFCSGKS